MIGGFSGQWGEGDKISKKRRLLESEGVTFDARTGRINPGCLLSSIPADVTSDHEAEVGQKSKCKKVEETDSKRDNNSVGKLGESVSSASSPSEREIRRTALQIISERGSGKTC
jgi:hypothetical protein